DLFEQVEPLRRQLRHHLRDAGNGSPRTVETLDDSRGDGIGAGCHDDGNVTGALLSGRQGLEWPGNDHIHARALELCRLLWHQFTLAARIPWLHHESLPFHVAKLTHSLTECVHVQIIGGRLPTPHPPPSRNFSPLPFTAHHSGPPTPPSPPA